jgi:glycerate kinase
MPDHARSHPSPTPGARRAPVRGVIAAPRQLLVAGEPFGARLAAGEVLEAIAGGVRAEGLPGPDLCPLPLAEDGAGTIGAALEAIGFDERMRSARALILAVARLTPQTLAGSTPFELATRARQTGVPAYAITAENTLSAFEERILDLQLVLVAGDARALRAAARKLARLSTQV